MNACSAICVIMTVRMLTSRRLLTIATSTAAARRAWVQRFKVRMPESNLSAFSIFISCHCGFAVYVQVFNVGSYWRIMDGLQVTGDQLYRIKINGSKRILEWLAGCSVSLQKRPLTGSTMWHRTIWRPAEMVSSGSTLLVGRSVEILTFRTLWQRYCQAGFMLGICVFIQKNGTMK